MSLMEIPSHVPVTSQKMAERIVVTLRKTGLQAYRGYDDRQQIRGFGRERYTLVPFFMLCLEGSFNINTADSRSGEVKTQSVLPGMGLGFTGESYVGADFPHACCFFRATFEPDGVFLGFEEISENNIPDRDLNRSHLEAAWSDGPLFQPAAGLLEEILSSEEGMPERRRALAEALLWELIHRLMKIPARAEDADPAEMALRYLRDQCGNPINRGIAAEALGISSGYLGRLVKRATGHSFQQALHEMRIERARALLSHPNLFIEDVALQCGYTSANYFTQAFRREEGLSPSEWRVSH